MFRIRFIKLEDNLEIRMNDIAQILTDLDEYPILAPHSTYVQAPSKTNKFIIRPDPDTPRFLTVEYDIGCDYYNTYQETDCRVSILTDTQTWILYHPSPHEKPLQVSQHDKCFINSDST